MSVESINYINGPSTKTVGCVILIWIIFGPLLTILALNTLFPVLAIPFTFKTYLATLLLGSLFKSVVAVPVIPQNVQN